MKLKEWNLCLDYADFQCAEFPNIRCNEYIMYDGRRGIAFHIFDRKGNAYDTVYSGIHNSYTEMKKAIDNCLMKLLRR